MEAVFNTLVLDAVRSKYGIPIYQEWIFYCWGHLDYGLDYFDKEDESIPLVVDGFYYGRVLVFDGCGGGHPPEYKPFRIAIDGSMAEMQAIDGTYISVEEWLTL